MLSRSYTIQFVGTYDDRDYTLRTFENEYRNLMVLLKDKIGPDDFGQCGGMGRCGTCMVRVSGYNKNVVQFGNEETTLKKLGIFESDVRLSCHMHVNNDLNDITISISGS
ncbi:MAG: 2Fe-2S iron-sulfur cluster-binding protein [Flavisolibacter sp.]